MTRLSDHWSLARSPLGRGGLSIYDLSHPLEPGIPHFPGHPPFMFSLTKLHGEVPYPDGVSSSAEAFTTGGHVGTHIDAYGHVSRHGLVFGDRPIDGRQSYCQGIEVGSIDEIEPIFSRALVVNVPELLGRDVTATDEIGAPEFERWHEGLGGPDIEGAAVMVRTGWAKYWEDHTTYLGHVHGTPGVILSGARWLVEKGVTAVGSDTWAFERMPNPRLEVHVLLLVEKGVPIIEALNLEGVVAAGVVEFTLVVVPLRLTGATGSPVRPLAVIAAGGT